MTSTVLVFNYRDKHCIRHKHLMLLKDGVSVKIVRNLEGLSHWEIRPVPDKSASILKYHITDILFVQTSVAYVLF